MQWRRFSPEADSLKVYGYWRSSASWRVRWALALKNIPFDYIPVNLLKGEHKSPEHLKRNPMGLVPVLEIGEGHFLSESMAILEWVEEVYLLKGPALFPGTPLERAHVRSLCEIINSDTAPLQAPRAQKKYSSEPEKQNEWARDFISQGLRAFDVASRPLRKKFCVYDEVSAADIFLVPQIYNAIRYGIDVAKDFPELHRIYQECLKTSACLVASPETQSDAHPPSA